MFLKQIVLLIVSISLSLAQRMEDPVCVQKGCPAGTTCRIVSECSKPQVCVLKAECLENPPQWSHTGVCQVGDPILTMRNGVLDDTHCGPTLPCPDTTHCNTELMDTYATCCRSDPTNPVKPGSCPASTNTDTFFCVDTCDNDGDCRYDMKCCQDGCRKQCVMPKPVNPCATKVCPSGSYCLTPEMPMCTGPGQCYTVGDCVSCGDAPLCRSRIFCQFESRKDSRGCLTCMCAPRPPPRPTTPNRPVPPTPTSGQTNGNSGTTAQRPDGNNGNTQPPVQQIPFLSRSRPYNNMMWYYLMNNMFF